MFLKLLLPKNTSKEDTFSHLNQKEKFIKVFITLIIGAIGGVIAQILNIPSGAMILSIFATAIYNIYYRNAFMPLRLRQLIQVLAGALIGAKMTLGDIVSLKEIFIPVGIVIMGFSMVATAIYNIYSSNAFMPLRLRQLIQVLAGALIGAKMTLGDIVSLKEIFIPVGIVIMGFCLMNLLLGILIYKITDFSVETSLFATAPGGMSDISIIARLLFLQQLPVECLIYL